MIFVTVHANPTNDNDDGAIVVLEITMGSIACR